MKITEKKVSNSGIELGDIIKVEKEGVDNFLLVVEAQDAKGNDVYHDVYRLVNLDFCNIYYREFADPKHIHNHIKKHFGDYELYKSHQIELKLG